MTREELQAFEDVLAVEVLDDDSLDDRRQRVLNHVRLLVRQDARNRDKIRRMVAWLRRMKDKIDDALAMADEVLSTENGETDDEEGNGNDGSR